MSTMMTLTKLNKINHLKVHSYFLFYINPIVDPDELLRFTKIETSSQIEHIQKRKIDWKYWGIRLIQHNKFLGPLVMIVVYIISTIFLIPGTLMTLGIGVVLQLSYQNTWLAIIVGVSTVYVGAVLGSTCAMLLGRFVFRETLIEKSKRFKLFRAIDKAVETEGRKLVLLLRLCPIAPFTVLNYLFGITSIKVKDFMIGGFGMLPGAFVYVLLGTTISSIADAANGNFEAGVLPLIMLIFGTLLAIFAVVYISIVTKRYLNNNLIDLDSGTAINQNYNTSRSGSQEQATSQQNSDEGDKTDEGSNEDEIIDLESPQKIELQEDDEIKNMNSNFNSILSSASTNFSSNNMNQMLYMQQQSSKLSNADLIIFEDDQEEEVYVQYGNNDGSQQISQQNHDYGGHSRASSSNTLIDNNFTINS
eukprot:403332511